MPHAVVDVVKRFVKRKRRVAAQAEDHLDAQPLERAHAGFTSVHGMSSNSFHQLLDFRGGRFQIGFRFGSVLEVRTDDGSIRPRSKPVVSTRGTKRALELAPNRDRRPRGSGQNSEAAVGDVVSLFNERRHVGHERVSLRRHDRQHTERPVSYIR